MTKEAPRSAEIEQEDSPRMECDIWKGSKAAQTVISGLMLRDMELPVLAVKRRRPHKAQSIADRWEPSGVRLR